MIDVTVEKRNTITTVLLVMINYFEKFRPTSRYFLFLGNFFCHSFVTNIADGTVILASSCSKILWQ